jgi:hypothetical protein
MESRGYTYIMIEAVNSNHNNFLSLNRISERIHNVKIQIKNDKRVGNLK